MVSEFIDGAIKFHCPDNLGDLAPIFAPGFASKIDPVI
jgi:hypothetical protein